MRKSRAKQLFEELLAQARVTINGSNPWDLVVHNEDFYQRVLKYGPLGLGESYMDGWWDCRAIDEFVFRVLRAKLPEKILAHLNPIFHFFAYQSIQKISCFFNPQTKIRSREVAEKHYNLGNLLFIRMLDPYMNYSCGFWQHSNSLEDAQAAKMALICRKLQLQPGMRVLDIGCGWGGFARYAAENYGVQVVGITISEEQQKYAQKICQDLPVTIRLEDYRELAENYDRIVSVGMFEHVGVSHYKTYMQVVRRCLDEDGLFLLHTIGSNLSLYQADPWISKYVFPNGLIPSIKQIGEASEDELVMEDWHNFSADYDKTLLVWRQNFYDNWEFLREQLALDERFYRMWVYYLSVCAGAFRARDLQLWQIVFSRTGIVGGYRSIR